jgi:uncharacterized membrane protein YdjX (TVP38/TMEM64 family)
MIGAMTTLRRFWPLLLIAAALALFVAFGLPHQLSWAALAHREVALQRLVGHHPVAAALAFTVLYAALTSLAVPESAVVTVAGGLLFGTVLGAICTVLGATAGAIVLFLAARSTLRPLLERRARLFLKRVGPALERDGFNALLALRLLPIMPFWLMNLAPALAGMRLVPYAAATFIGIIPGTIVFTSIGAGLGDTLARGEAPDLSVVLSPSILGPLAGLAALALLPIALRRLRRRGG